MSLVINIGEWGGFYPHFSRSAWRICLGFIAFTIYPFDMDDVLLALSRELEKNSGA